MDEFDAFLRGPALKAEVIIVAACKQAARVGCEVAERVAKTEHRFVNRTGALEASIGSSPPVPVKGGAIGTVFARRNYASFVDAGTRPHVIRARRKPFLVFKVNGVWVRAKQVNHPGTRPEGFMGNAVLKAEPYMNAEIEKGVVRANGVLGG